MTFCCCTHLFYFSYSWTSLPLPLLTSCNKVSLWGLWRCLPADTQTALCLHWTDTNNVSSPLRCAYMDPSPHPDRALLFTEGNDWIWLCSGIWIPFYQNPSNTDVVARGRSILTESNSREICLIDSPIPLGRLWRAKGNFWRGDTDILLVDSFSPPAEYFSGEVGAKWQEEIAQPLTLHRKCVLSFAETRDLKCTILLTKATYKWWILSGKCFLDICFEQEERAHRSKTRRRSQVYRLTRHKRKQHCNLTLYCLTQHSRVNIITRVFGQMVCVQCHMNPSIQRFPEEYFTVVRWWMFSTLTVSGQRLVADKK